MGVSRSYTLMRGPRSSPQSQPVPSRFRAGGRGGVAAGRPEPVVPGPPRPGAGVPVGGAGGSGGVPQPQVRVVRPVHRGEPLLKSAANRASAAAGRPPAQDLTVGRHFRPSVPEGSALGAPAAGPLRELCDRRRNRVSKERRHVLGCNRPREIELLAHTNWSVPGAEYCSQGSLGGL